MKKIILNYLTPASVTTPSPALSILKSYLKQYEIDVSVKYWNILLEPLTKKLWWTVKLGNFQETEYLTPFFNYISRKYNAIEVQQELEARLHASRPSYRNEGADIYANHLEENLKELQDVIDETLGSIDFAEVALMGFSAKLYQWIGANVIAEIVKERYPHVKIVAGGFGTHEQAFEMLRNYSYYDFALWGEGEWPLLQLCNTVNNNKDTFDEIPFLIYRKDDKILKSTVKNEHFLDLNSGLIPDYSDFFEQTSHEKENINFPIEGSRGCHWNKCRFCYLNEGYRYRCKSVENIVSELRYQMDKYGVYKVNFLDNDIIGKNVLEYERLLDSLIVLREEYPKFQIHIAEIVSKGLNSGILKKMALAGFRHIQIGYESPSNELLKKIHKKNTFASNLLVIKWAKFYNILVSGANIIKNLLEETEEDIMEGIDNLHYLRFIFERGYFRHLQSCLGIIKASRYYKELEEQNLLHKWDNFYYKNSLPKNYFLPESKYNILLDHVNYNAHNLWSHFNTIEQYYLSNSFDFNIIKSNEDYIYIETCNKQTIKELCLSKIDWIILCFCNDQVQSLDNLFEFLQKQQLIENMEELKSFVADLKKESVLYANSDYSEIVTVINTIFTY